MSESTPDQAPTQQLREFLDDEHRQAERDFPSLSQRPRSRSRRPLALFAIILLVSVVVVPSGYLVLGGSRMIGGPSGQTPAKSASSTPWPDGLPQVLNGQPVFRGDAITTHVAAATDDSRFLIGGFPTFVQSNCPTTVPDNPLVQACLDGWLLRDSAGFPYRTEFQLVVGEDFASGPGAWNQLPEVLRVHVNDPAARTCPSVILQQCKLAIVVEAVVWAGAA